MKHRGPRPTQREQEDPARTPGTASDQRAAPGKRTATMGLPGRAPTSSRTVQHDASMSEQRPARELVEDWTLVAMRPDLHQTPMVRPSDEVGMAAGPATGAVQMKKGDHAVSEGGGGDRERKKESRRERDERRGEMKPEEIEQAGAWMALFLEAERLRVHQQGREEHEITDRLREQFLQEIEQREEDLLARADEIEWPERIPIFDKAYQESHRVLGNLNSAPMDMVDAHEHMIAVLTAWHDDMETFVVEAERERERREAEEQLRQVRLSVDSQLGGPQKVLRELIQELGREIPKGTRNGNSLEKQRKQLLKEAQALKASCESLPRTVTVTRPGTAQVKNLVRNVGELESNVDDWIEQRDDALGPIRGSSQGGAKTITRTQVTAEGIPTGHVHQDALAELHRYLNRWHMYDDILRIWNGTGEDRPAPYPNVVHHHANGSFQHNLLYHGTVILGVVDGHMQTKARTGVDKVEDKVVARDGGPTVEVALTGDGVYRVVDG